MLADGKNSVTIGPDAENEWRKAGKDMILSFVGYSQLKKGESTPVA